jgi:hypothetical protein
MPRTDRTPKTMSISATTGTVPAATTQYFQNTGSDDATLTWGSYSLTLKSGAGIPIQSRNTGELMTECTVDASSTTVEVLYGEIIVDGLGNVGSGGSSSGGSSSVQAEYTSPSDFTTVWTSAGSVTVSSLPISISDSSQIVYIKATNTTDKTSTTFVQGANGYSFYHSGGIIQIYKSGTIITDLTSGKTWKFEVGLNGSKKGYDLGLNAFNVSLISDVTDRRTDPINLIPAASPQTITTSWVALGSEISAKGFTMAVFYVNLDINTATGVQLRAVGRKASGGSDYDLAIESLSAGSIGIEPEVLQFTNDADQLMLVKVYTDGLPYIELQVKSTGGTADAQIDELDYHLIWVGGGN